MVGEFFLIVIGVLVALGLEAAFENRRDDGLRDEYISRLQHDIQTDRDAIVWRIEFFTAVKGFSNTMLDWLGTDAPADKDLLLASFYAAEAWPFFPNLSTYQDLQNTGNIRLLDDIDFRTSLSVYYIKANMARSGWNPSEDYREIIRGIIPNQVQGVIRSNCPTTDEMDLKPTGFPPCQLGAVDYERINELFAPLKDDVEFHRILTYRDSELGVMLYLLGQQIKFADEVLARIDDEL
jgi:hypothetical protein